MGVGDDADERPGGGNKKAGKVATGTVGSHLVSC